ncbi:hypothetical protein [Burkholderia cenocepacia]|uniref:hypothetical protein n=1 Tax=Burkholderia cenocepacia TaxID=95486 RepID=UPI0013DFA9C8|nr:hypothetical protein [Burkholderia cenocepacia]MCW3585089.1 hypothetical protein [Burkholderia cenocepacia]MCW3630411.1 hypothetical protein [Burkholderia cenocepacia]MCW5178695.1 hypothetical protein [Burkholderia cenocepacia]
MNFIERRGGNTATFDQRPSTLLAALRRVGKRLPVMHDVEGFFQPNAGSVSGDRVFGVLETHDARVNIAFDAARVTLPHEPGVLRVSGKVWLGEKTSMVTLLVTQYRVVEAHADKSCPVAEPQG